MKNNLERKGNGLALIPFLVFVGIYLGAGLYLEHKGVEMSFYQFPSVTAMFLAVLLAFMMTKGSISERFRIFSKGAANEDILTMLMIYLLAGAFSSVATAMGGLDSTINLGLALIPVRFLSVGMFLISAFMGTATGSSMGTISAIVPIAIGVADKSGISVPLMIGSCIGGAMFGDNLSMISDTTIAATRSQGVEMKDKFKVNIKIAVPAALLTIIVLLIFGQPKQLTTITHLDYSLIKVLPYLLVLILAVSGLNVFAVLTIGIFSAAFIGLGAGSLDIFSFAQNIYSGFQSMNEVFFLTLFCGGMSELVAYNGGIIWLINKLKNMMKGNKSAQVGIAVLVSLADFATANNTVAIVVSGKVAKDISNEYRIDPRRTASLLDIFACVIQGIIPYGAQLLIATSLANAYGIFIAPTDIIAYIWYCLILALFGLISIYIPYADSSFKKDPWNFEHNRPESKVKNL